ncbi:MAG: hypothetical protein LH472_15365 [Pyrinomonadaceae bacterium]|nr:hypothetical protein [Pyrinomonadaceae bacterium]
MTAESFWEKVAEAALKQGDYLTNCPVPFYSEIPQENLTLEIQIGFANLIIVTQSCDLENGKNELVALCPIYSVAEFEQVNPKAAQKGFWEQVRKAKIEGFHLFSPFENPENNRECLVVDFREIYSLPFEFLTKHAESLESRRRLKSPYLEHFSQAFARFFMRAGLPANIPPFK